MAKQWRLQRLVYLTRNVVKYQVTVLFVAGVSRLRADESPMIYPLRYYALDQMVKYN